MKIRATSLDGYRLIHDGAIELAKVEANGIYINRRRLGWTKEKLSKRIAKVESKLKESKVWETWVDMFGAKANLKSRKQLGQILHDRMGYEVMVKTQSGIPATGEEVLQRINHPFVGKYLRMMKYEKTLSTYIKGIEKEIVGDRIHPVFNLHIARTFRSSSDSPNFQNMPVRDKEISKIIRSLITASPGNVLVENDFKGIEVSVSACYHKDQNFISYITTPGKDMHRDMAAQLYMLKPEQVSKDARYGAKNKFVFPQFYGDYYISCAKALWEWIEKGKLEGPDGIPLKDHLNSHGIWERGECDPELSASMDSFEKHVQEVEDDFWNNRFRKYGQWRRDWYQSYLDKGYFDMLSGFRVRGFFNRNSVTNYPIQGSAFHCLLWSLVRVNRLLRKYKMRSRIIGQIHDSLLGDVPPNELQNYLEIVERVTTVELRKHFRWIIVPMEIEYEISPPGSSWHDKREIHFHRGRFHHPTRPGKTTNDALKFLNTLRK